MESVTQPALSMAKSHKYTRVLSLFIYIERNFTKDIKLIKLLFNV